MKFVKHPEHTRFMNAPHDWNEERDGPCGALSIHDQRDQTIPRMESCWEPEGFEPVSLALGLADIRLGIIGKGHPPVYMAVYPKTGKTRDDVKAAMHDVLTQLVEYAAQNELQIAVADGQVKVAEKA